MTFYTVLAVVCLSLLIVFCDSRRYNPRGKRPDSGNECPNVSLCGFCGRRKNVTLRVENNLVEPFFNHSIHIVRRRRQLIHFLEDAADAQTVFRFSADYFGGLGYLITTINQLRANFTIDESWWAITDVKGTLLPCGVSTYIPRNRETIIFKYVRGSHQ